MFHYQVGDTLRSARSVASVRSVTIHPRLSWTSLCQHCWNILRSLKDSGGGICTRRGPREWANSEKWGELRRRQVTVTPQGDRVPLQPAAGEQRQGNRGQPPPHKAKKKHKWNIIYQERRPPSLQAGAPSKERRQEQAVLGGELITHHYHRLGDFIL